MTKFVIHVFLIISFSGHAQNNQTKYTVIDYKQKTNQIYIKKNLSDSITTFYKLTEGHNSIYQIRIIKSRIDTIWEVVSEKYMFASIGRPFKGSTSDINFDSLEWKERETWNYKYKNDTIRFIELSEYQKIY